MADASPVLHAENLRVHFGDTVALDGLDFRAPAGTIVALLGPNGAGKTTFVRSVATLQRPTAGALEVAGIDVQRAPGEVRRRIGLAGQHAAVVDRLTGRENLTLVARLYGQPRRDARRSASRIIEALGLDGIADRAASTCSGGQRRLLDLAASLVGEPELLLLDEPTSGVDPHNRLRLWQHIRDLPGRGTSVLLTTQYLDEAAALADQVVILDRGRVIAFGTPEELRRSAGTTSLTVRTDGPIPRAAAAVVEAGLGAETCNGQGVLTAVGTFRFAAAAEAIGAAGIDPTEAIYRPPTLDEVFLSLTSRPERKGG